MKRLNDQENWRLLHQKGNGKKAPHKLIEKNNRGLARINKTSGQKTAAE